MSLSMWTATSQRPSSSACRRTLVITWPPAKTEGSPPSGPDSTSSYPSRMPAALRLSATSVACDSARADARVPTRTGSARENVSVFDAPIGGNPERPQDCGGVYPGVFCGGYGGTAVPYPGACWGVGGVAG